MSPKQNILNELASKNRNISWLASEVGVSVSHLFRVFKTEGSDIRELSESLLKKINKVLGTDFKKEE